MADPLSLVSASAGLAATAFKLGRSIASFTKKVSDVDRSVQQLQFQVEGLGSVLETLSEELDRPEFASHTDSLAKPLVRNLPKTIDNCSTTITAIQRRITKLQPPDRRNLIKQTWRAVKLQWNQSEIDESLGHVKMHSMNLQLSLSVVSLHNSLQHQNLTASEQHQRFDTLEQLVQSQTTFATDQLERFDKLEQMIDALTERLGAAASTSTPSSNPYLHDIPVDDCTRSIVEGARGFVSSASTTMGRSSAGRTVLLEDAPAFEFIGATAAQGGIEESTTGSEWGNPLDADRRMHLQSWVQHTPTFEGIAEEAMVEHSSLATSLQQAAPSNILTETSNHNNSLQASDSQTQASELFFSSGEDDDDDIETELAAQIFRSATDLAKTSRWEQARVEFEEGFRMIENFSAKRLANVHIPEMKIQYGKCTFAVGLRDEAEKILTEVAELQPTDVETLQAITKARRTLAAVKLASGNADSAEAHCRQVLTVQRKARAIGKAHPEYHETLVLMSLIMLARGQIVQSRHYAEHLADRQKPAAKALLFAFFNDPDKQRLFPLMHQSPQGADSGILSDLRSPSTFSRTQVEIAISSCSFGTLLKIDTITGASMKRSTSNEGADDYESRGAASRTDLATDPGSIVPKRPTNASHSPKSSPSELASRSASKPDTADDALTGNNLSKLSIAPEAEEKPHDHEISTAMEARVLVEHLPRTFYSQQPASAGSGEVADEANDKAEAAEEPASEFTSDFTFLRTNPHFKQLKQILQDQPTMLEPILQQIAAGNPRLAHLIANRADEFLELLAESPEEETQTSAPSGPVTVSITQDERDAIERLCLLGFDRDLVIQAYFACEKNEELTAHFLFDYEPE